MNRRPAPTARRTRLEVHTMEDRITPAFASLDAMVQTATSIASLDTTGQSATFTRLVTEAQEFLTATSALSTDIDHTLQHIQAAQGDATANADIAANGSFEEAARFQAYTDAAAVYAADPSDFNAANVLAAGAELAVYNLIEVVNGAGGLQQDLTFLSSAASDFGLALESYLSTQSSSDLQAFTAGTQSDIAALGQTLNDLAEQAGGSAEGQIEAALDQIEDAADELEDVADEDDAAPFVPAAVDELLGDLQGIGDAVGALNAAVANQQATADFAQLRDDTTTATSTAFENAVNDTFADIADLPANEQAAATTAANARIADLHAGAVDQFNNTLGFINDSEATFNSFGSLLDNDDVEDLFEQANDIREDLLDTRQEALDTVHDNGGVVI